MVRDIIARSFPSLESVDIRLKVFPCPRSCAAPASSCDQLSDHDAQAVAVRIARERSGSKTARERRSIDRTG